MRSIFDRNVAERHITKTWELEWTFSKLWSRFHIPRDTSLEESRRWNSNQSWSDITSKNERKPANRDSTRDCINDDQRKTQSSLKHRFIGRRQKERKRRSYTWSQTRRWSQRKRMQILQKSESDTRKKKRESSRKNMKRWFSRLKSRFCMKMRVSWKSWIRSLRKLLPSIKFLFHIISRMNQCRICWKAIPRIFNWWPALRCSKCRAIKDDELETAIEDAIDVYNESESLIEDAKRFQMRNKLLQQRNQVLLNDNQRLESENEKLRKWVERLFERIHVLEWRNAEWLKDYKQLKSEILLDNSQE